MPFIDEAVLERIAESARQARAEVMGVGESTIRRTADVLEIGGTAGALGFANARWGTSGQLSVAGIPVNLLVALAGLGTSWFGFAGRYGRDAEMIGAGALAGYLAQLGTSYGASSAAQAGAGPEIVNGAMAGGSPRQMGAHSGAPDLQGGKKYVVQEMQ
jgi:hypothetical protein